MFDGPLGNILDELYGNLLGTFSELSRSLLGNILDELGEVDGVGERLFPIGRLDKDSSGPLLLLPLGRQPRERTCEPSLPPP